MKLKSVFLAGRFGFTLVELLVVISIIGLLAGLAIPGINRALDAAADTEDLNKLKQIGQGVGSFITENNGQVPNASIPVPGSTNPSFMESVDRFFPPDSKFSAGSIYNWARRSVWFSTRHAKNPPGKSASPSYPIAWGTAWGMNARMWGETNSFNGYINRAPNLSRLVLVGEKNNTGHDFEYREAPVYERNVVTKNRISRNGSAYYVFADLHIEKIKGDQSLIANPGFESYNPTNLLYYKFW
jgi:prepilin-type N-terminal cleavage/methylation domain-containing protein